MLPLKNVCRPVYFSFFLLLALLAGCGGGGGGDKSSTEKVPTSYTYQQPDLLNDGWQVAHIDEFSISPAGLERAVRNVASEASGYRYIDSITIIKGNKIILDENFGRTLDMADGWANNTDPSIHILNSVTKSFASALIGIAIDQDYIQDVNVKVHDYFQHKLPVSNWGEDKANITLKNWLTMRHGYEWDEWDVSYLDNSNLNSQMNNSIDPIYFLLSRPMTTTPGETFAYSTGVSFGLGRLLEHATGQSVTSFMEQNLFSPLGINNYTYWALDGQLHTGSALYLSPRDMAKFGQLFLNEGQWDGQQVISSEWVTESTQRYHDAGDWGYGYQWWNTDFNVNGEQVNSFYADGFGGQYIFVLPSLDAVVVFTGHAYQSSEQAEYRVRSILENDILPAL
ncbi:serine hydrolase [Thalassotalea sp. M1531]|uniref:Serine hydrolase n=1 Tax=Thalassotalea algicola TaxID=2716224 RepID=A0A7Y0L9G8_9GAMM|nr:serine hydrolase [Thalassotalea algicola]NMP30232.1 serine hydrolase [Thalassotalea algicola]